PMRTLKLTVAYDGTHYVGVQRQANGVSIQQCLEDALAPLAGDPGGRGPTVAGASRTDAGVHALGQVASVNVTFDVAASAVQRALNVRLPADIRVIGVVDATPGFHARFHSTGKTYRYRIATTPVLSPFDRWFVWHSPGSKDVEAMRAAAAAFVGKHDFASFQGRGGTVRHTVRTIHRLDIREAGGEIVFEVEGNGFLRHMVRTLVGTLVEVGTGQRPADGMTAVLAARDRRAAGPTTPASGLTLMSVRY
ncbi:MAG TPA: tRNA pseudouridine(38-40) synthase TruA, partial [Vicinamibacterales bacterium]|nr:tRNA pseudouridine(38-40) synthase TruA [Vicinamibacterales bacterium]